MAITLRQETQAGTTTKGSSLTYAELDNNFIDLVTLKITQLGDDTTPQLGGSLDVNGQSIVSVSNGNIAITPNGSGIVQLDGLNWPTADGTAGYVLKTNGGAQLSWVAQPTAGIANIVEDTSPQLGGALDAQTNNFTNVGTLNTHTIPGGTGTIALTSNITFSNLVEDTSPQLGGNLDLNSSNVTGTGNVSITGNVTAQSALNAQTGTTYTAVLTDASKLVTLTNGGAITLTIPANSGVAYAVGTKIDFAQLGAGQVTVAGAGGVTVNATPGLKFRAQYSGATCIKTATDTWILVGDLSA